MIDIHSHILPGLDDGARSMAEAMAMAEKAAADGITQMIATPHAFNGLSHNPRSEEVLRRVDALQKAVGSGIAILPGNEVRYTDDIVGKARSGRLMTLNRRQYVLIEFPTPTIPRGCLKQIRNLREWGMTPILAHPERNRMVQAQPSLLAGLIAEGALVQVTAMSVTGRFGDEALVCAEKLLRASAVHFIASDAHRPDRRPPTLSEGRDAAAKIVGRDRARALVGDNPATVIRGGIVLADQPAFERKETSGLLTRLFSPAR
jgi:protein-tyrosine phosphatase